MAEMLRILRAFAWLRWRVFANSLDVSGARDAVERLSLTVEQIGPLIAAALMIPSAVLLAGAGAYAGWALGAEGGTPFPLRVLRYVLLVASGLCIVGPFLLPAGERTNTIRLLLLPIPRGALYVAQSAAALADPWLLLVLPVALAIPAGLAAAGAWTAALLAAGAGIVLVFLLVALASLATSVLALTTRNRRRGELLALLFIVFVPLVALAPQLLDDRGSRGTRRSREAPAWIVGSERTLRTVAPSELYLRSVRRAAGAAEGSALVPVAGLGAAALVLHGLGLFAFGRLLDIPASGGGRRQRAETGAAATRLPGLSAGASAVALAQWRLALRTPRGRSVLLSPAVVFIMFGFLAWRGSQAFEFGFVTLQSGLGLATFGGCIALIAIQPLAMNQFAIDRSGLTLAFLSPLSDTDLLLGKAVANGVIAAIPAGFCVLGAAAIFPGGPAALWLSVPLALAATYVLIAPAAALFSALFPRAVDLNSIGRGSNAHGAAGFLGLLLVPVAAAPSALLVLAATRLLDRPALAPVLLLLWCALACGASRLLFIPVRRIFNARRENLALVA